MNQMNQKKLNSSAEENVLFGVIGAFLFSLAGSILYVLLSRIGYIAAVSGLVAVVCAIKGYTFFAKAETKRGVIISVIIAALMLILAWYISFCLDMVDAYAVWYETGEVDYAPTIFEYLPYGFYDLTVNLVYFIDLALSLVLGAVGCGSYVASLLKRQKLAAQTPAAAPAEEAFSEEKTDEI